jgi:glycosyltransferase involved in cell wall biosynthesis
MHKSPNGISVAVRVRPQFKRTPITIQVNSGWTNDRSETPIWPSNPALRLIEAVQVTRILQIHTRYRQPGGEDGVADAEVDLLRQAGHEVIAVRRRNSASGREAMAQLAAYPWNPASTRRLMRLAGRTRPHVAHLHNTWFATSPGVLRSLRRAGIPTVVTVHNYRLACVNAELLRDGAPCELCVGKVPWRGVRHRCYRGSAGQSAVAALGIQSHRALGPWSNGVDRFITLTEFSRGRLIASGLPAERVVVRPNFVADPGPRAKPPSDSHRILFAGRLSSEKGLDVALRAWNRSRPAGLELVVAGDGPARQELEALAGPGVRFLGRVPRAEVDALLLSSRAVLFPSLWFESQPLGVLEAFAAGAPVLAAAIGGLGETAAPLGTEWQVKSGDVDAWAVAFGRLADDGAVDRGGAAARKAFEQRHTAGQAREMLERTYEEAGAAAPSEVPS